jgi:redox-regulated HSP33 family molecular chaperone
MENVGIHEKIIQIKYEIERNFVQLGAMLKIVRDQELYKEKSCETFEEYIAQPELSLARSTVYAIINVYETFFEKSEQSDLIEIGYSKLNRIAQFKGNEDFEEWIYKAKTLSLSDLGKEIKEVKGETVSEAIEIKCPYCGREFVYQR